MGVEIERKFLLVSDQWRTSVDYSHRMVQGYLGARDEGASVRVRITGDEARLNIKGRTLGARRLEFEYPVPLADAEVMLRELAGTQVLAKTRHYIHHEGHRWEIDEFEGDNAGLIVAEIELGSERESFVRPPWLGREVTDDPRYYNVCLVETPYSVWPAQDGPSSKARRESDDSDV
jgi:adenylate cyclase